MAWNNIVFRKRNEKQCVWFADSTEEGKWTVSQCLIRTKRYSSKPLHLNEMEQHLSSPELRCPRMPPLLGNVSSLDSPCAQWSPKSLGIQLVVPYHIRGPGQLYLSERAKVPKFLFSCLSGDSYCLGNFLWGEGWQMPGSHAHACSTTYHSTTEPRGGLKTFTSSAVRAPGPISWNEHRTEPLLYHWIGELR